jgi:hypothetical protein
MRMSKLLAVIVTAVVLFGGAVPASAGGTQVVFRGHKLRVTYTSVGGSTYTFTSRSERRMRFVCVYTAPSSSDDPALVRTVSGRLRPGQSQSFEEGPPGDFTCAVGRRLWPTLGTGFLDFDDATALFVTDEMMLASYAACAVTDPTNCVNDLVAVNRTRTDIDFECTFPGTTTDSWSESLEGYVVATRSLGTAQPPSVAECTSGPTSTRQ